MPYVSNFSNIGGFVSGFLAGFALLFKTEVGQGYQAKGGIFDYNIKRPIQLKTKLDKPVLRTASLIIFTFM